MDKIKIKKENPFDRGEPFALAELREPTLTILKQFRENIESGAYDVVLADDASGRIPGLLIWNVLKEIYKKHGYQTPLMRFVAGSAGSTPETLGSLNAYVSKIKQGIPQEHNGKILIVTDTIYTGWSLKGILQALKRSGLEFDIATIGTLDEATLQEIGGEYNCKIAYGMNATPSIYHTRNGKYLPGVVKSRGVDVIARKDPSIDQKKVNAARLFLRKKMVSQLVRAYEENQ